MGHGYRGYVPLTPDELECFGWSIGQPVYAAITVDGRRDIPTRDDVLGVVTYASVLTEEREVWLLPKVEWHEQLSWVDQVHDLESSPATLQ